MSILKTVGDVINEIESANQNVRDLENIIRDISEDESASDTAFILAESKLIIYKYTDMLRTIPVKEDK